MKLKLFTLISMVALLAVITASCTKDDDDTQPDLPPLESLSMDFSDFTTFPDTSLKSAEPYNNFASAFGTVAFWNLVTALNMIVPVAAYVEAFNHTPEYLGDNTWQWSYSVTILAQPYEAKLKTKRIDNSTFSAEMYVTKTDVYDDFLWFEGVVSYDGTQAEWTMFKDPPTGTEWLTIDWNKDWVADTSNMTYTITEAGHNEFGSYISMGLVDDVDYDAFYTIATSQDTVDIKFNTTTNAGRIKSHGYFGDMEWHCWDENYMNVTCSK